MNPGRTLGGYQTWHVSEKDPSVGRTRDGVRTPQNGLRMNSGGLGTGTAASCLHGDGITLSGSLHP